MTKTTTQSRQANNLIIISFGVLLIAAIGLGIYLSNDQSYSPLPSAGGLITELIVLLACGGFITYACSRRVKNPAGFTRAVAIGLGAVFAGFLLVHLVRMLLS